MNPTGNRLTDNALTADDGKALIERALREMGAEHGYRLIDEKVLFTGVYYDRTKVGSFIAHAKGPDGQTVVLKLQLRPLPYDEGSIIRHVSPRIRSSHIRLPRIISDAAWSEERGYGYLIFEDLSDLENLWLHHNPDDEDVKRHGEFLKEFFSGVLPMESWIPVPDIAPKEKYKESFAHFAGIAKKSTHRHISLEEIDQYRDRYFEILERMEFEGFQFSHGHLSGKDVKYDPANNSYVILANLLWSYRPYYYEIAFPFWVNLMDLRDPNLTLDDVLRRLDLWIEIGSEALGKNLREKKQHWFNLVERSVLTIILDIGSGEWKEDEKESKAALLRVWKELFEWLIREKDL